MVERIVCNGSPKEMKQFRILQADVFVKDNVGTQQQRDDMIKHAQDIKKQADPTATEF